MMNGLKSSIFIRVAAYLVALTIKSLLPLGQRLFYIECAETGIIRSSSYELRTRYSVDSKTALVCGLFGNSLVVKA